MGHADRRDRRVVSPLSSSYVECCSLNLPPSSTWFWPVSVVPSSLAQSLIEIFQPSQRNEVPDSVKSATNSIDPSNWGTPSAAWPSSSCNVSKFFDEQQLVIDITLCGQWFVYAFSDRDLHSVTADLSSSPGRARHRYTSPPVGAPLGTKLWTYAYVLGG